MKIAAVSLHISEKAPGDPHGLPKKTFKSEGDLEVHLEPASQLVMILRKGSDRAWAFHVSQVEKLELTSADALALLTDPRPPKKAS